MFSEIYRSYLDTSAVPQVYRLRALPGSVSKTSANDVYEGQRAASDLPIL